MVHSTIFSSRRCNRSYRGKGPQRFRRRPIIHDINIARKSARFCSFIKISHSPYSCFIRFSIPPSLFSSRWWEVKKTPSYLKIFCASAPATFPAPLEVPTRARARFDLRMGAPDRNHVRAFRWYRARRPSEAAALVCAGVWRLWAGVCSSASVLLSPCPCSLWALGFGLLAVWLACGLDVCPALR